MKNSETYRRRECGARDMESRTMLKRTILNISSHVIRSTRMDTVQVRGRLQGPCYAPLPP